MGRVFQWFGVKKNQRTLMFLVLFAGAILGVYLKYQKEAGSAATESSAAVSDSTTPNTPETDKDKVPDLGSTGSQQSSKSSGSGISVNADRGASVYIAK